MVCDNYTAENCSECPRCLDCPDCIEYFNEMTALAEKGDAEAIAKLSYCYCFGIGTEVDEEKARKLTFKAAEMGFPVAIDIAGGYYYCDKNYEKAAEYFRRAAELGCEPSKENYEMAMEKLGKAAS